MISCEHSWLVPVFAANCTTQETNAIPQTSAEQEQEDQNAQSHPCQETFQDIRAVIVIINDVVDGAVCEVFR